MYVLRNTSGIPDNFLSLFLCLVMLNRKKESLTKGFDDIERGKKNEKENSRRVIESECSTK